MIWLYVFTSVFIVSLISLAGLFVAGMNSNRLKKYLLLLVSFSAGALLGDVFLHLLPETIETVGFPLEVSFSILGGLLLFFVIEKIFKWHHHHNVQEGELDVHSLGYMNLLGDGVHNFIDGVVIAASFLVSVPLGIATTLAVIFHEIPQEIGDFGVLLHSGFTVPQALKFNFLSALAAFLGAGVGLLLGSQEQLLNTFLLPFTAGTFLYIAGTDLIPELHKQETKTALPQLLALVFGILVMYALLFLEIA
ncbi:MAG: ZIP family metal transporter [Candidatus Diapherotrites archaeon]|nr:ZIP family metal transporter [Candidatus Diapherotrites archaeon]